MELSVTNLPASAETRKDYNQAQVEDNICSTVIRYCTNGCQIRKKIDVCLQPYWKTRADLTVEKNNVLLHGKRIVVPKSLQRQTLERSTLDTKE